ncbi:unnamed protein product [Discula destructiva]
MPQKAPPQTDPLAIPGLLIHHAQTRPHQPAFYSHSPHRRTTFATLATTTRRIAAHLLNSSLAKRGDRVAIVLPRCIEFVETILAITRACAIGVPLDPRSTLTELRWAFGDCAPQIVVTDRKGLGRVRGALDGVVTRAAGVVAIVVVDDDDQEPREDASSTEGEGNRIVRYEGLTAHEPSSEHAPGVLDSLGLDEPAWMHYTSGTTAGTPKGVLSSQRAWLLSAAKYADTMRITTADTVFWPLPLYHAFGHSLCIIGTLVIGGSVYLTGQGEGVLTGLHRCGEDVTVIAGVPSTYHELAAELALSGSFVKEACLPRPRLCISAGSTAPAGTNSRVEDMSGGLLLNVYGNTEACEPTETPMAPTGTTNGQIERVLGVPLLNRYGCTESCGAIAAHTPGGVYPEDSCGARLVHLEVKIMNSNTQQEFDGDALAQGQEGEIWIRGPSMMLRYWNAQTQHPSPFTDEGWYRTGDLGRLSSVSGRESLSVTGRLKELIRRGSETIHPVEIERVIRACPGVEDVVVAGIPHDMLGETPAAFVVRRSAQDAELDIIGLLAACRAVLPDYKVPVQFFEIGALPRTKAGKLRRRAAAECPSRPLSARNSLTEEMLERLVLAEVRAACDVGLEEQLDPALPFAELGMSSLAGVVLRDRLSSLTGLGDVPTTVVFDHPTPKAVTHYLRGRLFERIPSHVRAKQTQEPAINTAPKPDTVPEPIAIVSMACRYPGSISSPQDLWEAVVSGVDVTSPFPSDRGWDLEGLSNPDPHNLKTGASVTNRGGFLTDAALFDTAPFNISPREALATDPQQRLLLETTWQLAERARIAPSALRGSKTGVFVGVMYSDYAGRFLGADSHDLDSHLGLGSAASVAAGRISYTFDLHGPSMAIDTACSSSLVAMHLAANSLRSGECSLAIAGGVTVMATPRPFIMFSRQGGLAPDGRCKSYAAGADGTAWSEGVGLVMLERLSDAVQNGHEVLGLVRGSAVNSDGASNGLTAPSGPAQERVIRQALANAGFGPEEVDVLEGHGTATTLGDAIEAQAVVAAYGSGERDTPLLLGSVKSNIGHSQAAAGIAGVIKMVQSMKYGLVPKSLHVDKPSPQIANNGQVDLVTQVRPWPVKGNRGPRRAAVSSFGIGGTNGHIILEEYVEDVSNRGPTITLPSSKQTSWLAYPWILSGADEAGMRAQGGVFLDPRACQPGDAINIAYSLAATRSALPYRTAVLLRSDEIEDRVSALTALAQNQQHSDVVTSVIPRSAPRLAFIFSGQGSLNRGSIEGTKELCKKFPVFEAAFSAVCSELDSRLDHPLSEVIRDGREHFLNRTDLSQAMIFAFEVAMFRLLEYFGVRPHAVAGHSVGEIAAAHVSGYLSLTSAAALITTRGELMTALPSGQGAMASIAASKEDVAMALNDLTGTEGPCVIAAINSGKATVVSGSISAVSVIMDVFARRQRRVNLLQGVDHAFHSPLMEPVLEVLNHRLHSDPGFCNTSRQSEKIPFISTVTGKLANAAMLASPDYWTCQVRQPVCFADAFDTLSSMGTNAFLEVGPSAQLASHIADAITTRGQVNTLLESLGRLWVRGVQIDWHAVYEGSGARVVDLPLYQFQRRRYWLDPPPRIVERGPGAHAARSRGTSLAHPILTDALPVPGDPGKVVCHGYLSLEHLPWLADHAVGGHLILPATAYADFALHAGRKSMGETAMLEELAITKPLILTASECVVIQVIVSKTQTNDSSRTGSVQVIDIYSRPEHADINREWTRHANGALKSSPIMPPVATKPRWLQMHIDIEVAYAALANAGMSYGTSFRCVRTVWKSEDGEFLRAKLQLPPNTQISGTSSSFALHPILLDAALHARVLVTTADKSAEAVELRMPFLLRGVQIFGSLGGDETIFVQTSSRRILGKDGMFSVTLFDAQANVVAVAEVMTRSWTPTPQATGLFKLVWAPLDETCIEERAISNGSQDGVDKVVRVRDFNVQHPTTSLPDAVQSATAYILDIIQQWNAGGISDSSSRLVIVTERASGPDTNLVSAAVWGLVRSAQAEFGADRLVLVDLDSTSESAAAFPEALASGKGLVGVRDGRLMILNLSRDRVESPPHESPIPRSTLNTSGTILITGGTGALGSLIARHLVRTCNAKSLLLLSRSGPASPSAAALLSDLSSAGASIRILACDVAEQDQLSVIFRETNPPLTAIIHTAGIVDDGIVSRQTAHRVSNVLRPKVDAAWLLHELSSPDTQMFLFSSAAGVLGNRGQAGYAAGNCFLDGLSAYRRARGLHALSLAWGPWASEGGMAGGMKHGGMLGAMTDEQGLEAFDAAVRMGGEEAVIVPLLLQGRVVDSLPLPGPNRRQSLSKMPDDTEKQTSWKKKLAALQSRDDRAATLLGLVRNEVAAVLGYQAGDTLPDRPFADLGMDSFTAVQLRNRLSVLSGLKGLPATLAFDENTSIALVENLVVRFDQAAGDGEKTETDSGSSEQKAADGGQKSSEVNPKPRQADLVSSQKHALQGLASLWRRMCRAGQYTAATHTLAAASFVLPKFSTSSLLQARPVPRRLATGPAARPVLVAIPDFSLTIGEGRSRYTALSAAVGGRYDIYELPNPDVAVPESLEALAEMHVETIREMFTNRAVILVGYSAGGCVAHVVAHRLLNEAKDGDLVAGLVMIDTYAVSHDRNPEWLMALALPAAAVRAQDESEAEQDTTLAVMGAYLRLLSGWQAEPLPEAVHTLFVRAGKATPGAGEGWRPAEWHLAERTVDLPGHHHLEVLDDSNAREVAEIIFEWIDETQDGKDRQTPRGHRHQESN